MISWPDGDHKIHFFFFFIGHFFFHQKNVRIYSKVCKTCNRFCVEQVATNDWAKTRNMWDRNQGSNFPMVTEGHCLPYFKCGYDTLRPMSTFSVFFTIVCLGTFLLLCPMAWVPPIFKIWNLRPDRNSTHRCPSLNTTMLRSLPSDEYTNMPILIQFWVYLAWPC